jgi:hypothetical protein
MSATITAKVQYAEKGKVKEKEFEISIVPNRFNVLYGEYIEKSRRVVSLTEKLNAAKTVELVEAFTDEIKAIGLEALLELKYRLVEALMIGNGYEYDREWWDLRADPGSVDSFIVECALKDSEYMGKKKDPAAIVS